MIGDLSKGNEKSKCILIEDTVLHSGLPLLASFICNLSKRVEKVHIFCFDRPPNYFEGHIPPGILNRIVYHDASTDPLGIQGKDSLSLNSDLVCYLDNCSGRQAHHNVAIVIDNISLALMHRSAPFTCKTLAQLKEAKIQGAEVEQVVCLLHSDLHDNHSLTLVEHIATTIVKVIPPNIDQFLMATNTLHKRVSGKVIKIVEHFNIDEQYMICDVTEVKSLDTTALATNVSQQRDPTANLTFNLTLTEKEKEARSQVKLPYTYDKDKQDETLSKSVGEGKIFYQPDEADDFDEDDPDDDLDI